MMTTVEKEIAAQLVRAKGWPGFKVGMGVIWHYPDLPEFEDHIGFDGQKDPACIPDLSDWCTLGVLLGMMPRPCYSTAWHYGEGVEPHDRYSCAHSPVVPYVGGYSPGEAIGRALAEFLKGAK